MYEKLKEIIQTSKAIVFFGGAGVSTESDIPDFRSADGIYEKKTYPYPTEYMLSSDFFYANTEAFYDFYFHEMIYPNALPNPAHKALMRLERQGKLQSIITQNIDGLHQLAGSKEVVELHGSVHRNYCLKCHTFYSLEDILKQQPRVPRCSKCGGIIKPDVVLYGEGLKEETIQKAIYDIAHADTLIVGGTSLAVYPAAGLLQYFRGKHLVLINRDATAMDLRAQLVIHDPIGKVLDCVVEK